MGELHDQARKGRGTRSFGLQVRWREARAWVLAATPRHDRDHCRLSFASGSRGWEAGARRAAGAHLELVQQVLLFLCCLKQRPQLGLGACRRRAAEPSGRQR